MKDKNILKFIYYLNSYFEENRYLKKIKKSIKYFLK